MKFTDIINSASDVKSKSIKIYGQTVEIKTCIDINTFANIVHIIAETCYDENKYKAENREITRRYVILKYMTDIEVDEMDINDIFEISQQGDWYSKIEREVTMLPIWGEVEQAIDSQIASYPSAFDRTCDSLRTVLESDNMNSLEDVKETLRELNKVDKGAFIDHTIARNIAKNKDGDSNGSEKP